MPLESIIGDYRSFVAQQLNALAAAGFDLGTLPVSHLAYRTKTYSEYLEKRAAIEEEAVANVENVWRGRPMSKILLKKPLPLAKGHEVSLIELIPPVHLYDYPMGLEHMGLVIGETFPAFCEEHKGRLTGRQDQGPFNQPRFVTFDSRYTVKFYLDGLMDVVIKEGRSFDGFYHADWYPESRPADHLPPRPKFGASNDH